MTSSKPTALLWLALVPWLMFGCQRGAPETAAQALAGSAIHIDAISPDPVVPLHPGDKVHLRVDTSYTLTADTGSLSLVVQAGENGPLKQTLATIAQGSGKQVLEVEFIVPNATFITVVVPLFAQSHGTTQLLERRTYRVAAN